MKNQSLLLFTIYLFLTGCATGYHSRGFFGEGYSEIITNPDSFVVTFKGNAYTSAEKTLQYVLLRASELTIKNGYKYFVVISSVDQTSSYNYSNTYVNASGSADAYVYSNYANTRAKISESSSTYSGAIVKPGTSIRIKCFKENPRTDDVIDAEFYWNANKDG